MKKFAFLAIISLISIALKAQTAEPAATEKPAKRYSRPDIPGTFVLEIGLNSKLDAPSSFKTGFWGSRSLNLYYTRDIRILKSKFSLVPGIGFSMERFKFTNNRVLTFDGEDPKLLTPAQAGISNVRKSQMITNYLEIPVEIKFSTNPDDPARSFKASVGARAGVLIGSHSKVKYKEDGEVKKYKDNQNFNLNPIRYGVYGKIGVGNVSLFMYYNLSTLFEEGKGLTNDATATVTNPPVKDFTTFTIGLSLSSF